jgi:hypothetical protein
MSENDNRKVEDTSKDTIGFVKHSSSYDTNALNRAVEKASRDPSFYH